MKCTTPWCRGTDFSTSRKAVGYSVNHPDATWFKCLKCGAEHIDRQTEVIHGRARPRLIELHEAAKEARARRDDFGIGGTRAGGKSK